MESVQLLHLYQLVLGSDELEYAEWMGTKHTSALETSLREDVLWAVTLSEEDNRVTTFIDGNYRDYAREEIGGRWRPEE